MRSLLYAVTLAMASGGVATAQQPADSGARARADSVRRAQDRRAIDSLAAAVRALGARLDSAQQAAANAPPPAPAPVRTSGAYMNIGFDGLVDGGWSSTKDVPSLQRGDHDPKNRGFTFPNAEVTFDGAVDPYFKGFVNIVHKISAAGESETELEEAYVLTTALPANLQLKVGQFVTEFGRQNPQHPHAWSWVDEPLALNRLFGADGLRGPGARLSWLLPTKFYSEAMVTVQNSGGGTASSFRSDEAAEITGGVPRDRPVNRFTDLLIVPRASASIDLTSTQVLLFGASAAFGPNSSGPAARTSIWGGDVYWKWKSPRASAGFPFVSFQAEAMVRKYDAAQRVSAADGITMLPAQQLNDRGGYAQVLWGIRPRIVAGLRGEVVTGDPVAASEEVHEKRTRISPNFTIYPTEFSKIRLQYNYDHRASLGSDHSFWVQFEFILGAHAAHKF